MSKDSFIVLCDELRTYISKNTTRLRRPVSVEKQVAVALYYLSDEGRMRKCANAFGLGRNRSSSDNSCVNPLSKKIHPITFD